MRWMWATKTRLVWALIFIPFVMLTLAVLAPVAAMQVPAVRRQVHRWVEDQLSRSLGREVRMEGAAIRPWWGRLDLAQIRVAVGETPEAGTLFESEALRLHWSWKALLRHSIVLDRITFVRPRLTLQSTATSAANTRDLLSVFLQPRPIALDGWTLAIHLVEIENGLIAWGADRAGERVEGLSGTLRWPEDPVGEPSILLSLRAARLPLRVGDAARELRQASLQGVLTSRALVVTSAEVQMADVRLTAAGRILDPGGAAQVDLGLKLDAPLAALSGLAGIPKELGGSLDLEGRLDGPWPRLALQGGGKLRIRQTAKGDDPVPISVRWAMGRLEIETTAPDRAGSLSARLVLLPATGAYAARLTVRGADLDELSGLPSLAAHLAGLKLPANLHGRLTADVDLSGRGADLTALRGRGAIRVDGLSIEGDLPSGRLEARIVAIASRLSLETFALEIPGGTIRGRGSVGFTDGRVDVPIQADLKDVGAFARGFGFPLLGGKATLQGRLTGSREAPRFQGHLAWQNPRVALQTIDQIEADLDLTPRLLRTSRLVLRVGSTTATLRGSVAARGSAPLRTLSLKQDLILDLQGQINPGRTADIARFLPDDLGVRAAFRANGRIAGTPGAPTGEADITLTSPETWGERWQQGTVRAHLLPDGTELGPLLLQRGTERVSGALHLGKDGGLKGRLVGAGLDLSGLNFLADSRVAGRADIQADLQGSAGELRVAGSATSAALLFRGILLGPAAGAFSIAKQGMELDLTIQKGAQRMRLNLGPPPDRSLRLDLTLANADLDPILRIADVEPLRSWQTQGTGHLLLRGSASDLSAATGEATLSALRLRNGEQVWNNRIPVELSWRGQTITLRQMQLRSGEKEVDLRGTLGGGAENDFQVKGSIPFLTLQGMLPIVQPLAGEATADLRIRGPLSAPDMQGTLGIAGGRLTLRGIPTPIEELRGNVEFQGQRLSLRAFQGRFGGGNLRGSGELSRDGGQWSFRTTFQEDDGRAEQLLVGRTKEKGEVTGTLSLGGSLASHGQDENGFWSNLEGNLKLVMRDGQMGRQAVTSRILSIINIGQLFNVKDLNVSAQGFPYQKLTADIAIEHGVARTENLLFESRAFDLSAVGKVNLVEETIEMDLAVRPFQNVDWFFSKIPLAGWLLGGKEKSVVAAFYRVTGTLKDPQVTSLTAKSLGRNVFGIFLHLLDIPNAIMP